MVGVVLACVVRARLLRKKEHVFRLLSIFKEGETPVRLEPQDHTLHTVRPSTPKAQALL